MVSTNITKIFFRGNEIVALYKGDTLIFKKSPGGGSTTKPTGVYKIKGTVTKKSGYTQFNLTYNDGQMVNVKVNKDLTFETDLQEPLTNANAMFQGMSYLETLDLNGLDTSQVTNMSNMFSQSNYLKDIKLSSFDTSIVTDMSLMFNGCLYLKSLDLTNFNTSKVTNMFGMFANCSILKSLDLTNFNTSKVTNIALMFYGCNMLSDLYLNFDMPQLSNNTDGPFGRCDSLTNVVGKFDNYSNNLWFTDSPLTAQSAMVFINGLATVTEKRTLALSRTTYDSLTPEQIAIATSKGWTVIRN